MTVCVKGVALPVVLVVGACDDLRPLLPALAGLFVAGRLVFRDARAEHNAATVGRPDGGAGAQVERRQLARLTAGGGQQVELRLFAGTVRQERQPLAVRRPARRAVALGAARELKRLAARCRHEPDRRTILVGLGLNVGQDVGNAAAVG